ncbi:MAG: L-seryl-tRNA(Sec) selenium transferase [Pseudomonadota bacterium]|nr:L-seryl-tRNA(Sec) selenium transferase [Pseudomonadota bacterium]
MDPRRALPSVDRLLRDAPELPRVAATRAARALVAEVRAGAAPPADWTTALRARVSDEGRMRLRPVINATGIVLHTNLGRAPLSPRAAEAVSALARGYANVELELDGGRRGERLDGIRGPLLALTGAEDALAVNNCAAAVLLMLTTLGVGREVIVSRGELVEIGGSFRVPDVITAGGARLVEVGTTNRTRARDYTDAIGPNTAAILRVHPSNFRITGFTEAAGRAELAGIAAQRGVLLLEDLGAGALVPGLGEPTVAEVIAEGVDVACFSGDKLLGGPQAGLVVGKAPQIAAMRRHPLYRALRLDRLVLAALEATLRGYLVGDVPPVVKLLSLRPAELKLRARGWADRLRAEGLAVDVLPDQGFSGGGSLPGEGLPTWVVALAVPDPDRVAGRLRRGDPAVVARVAEGRIRLDPRTVLAGEEDGLLGAVVAACRQDG